MFIKGESNNDHMQFAAQQVAKKLNHDPELCRMLIPKWQVGCRRVTPGPDYLESFSRPNCHLTDSTVTHISEDAVHTADGQVFKCDVRKLPPLPVSVITR